MSTAITEVAPSCLAIPTGRLATDPPSTSFRPSSSTGANAPGIDMDARMAVAKRRVVDDDRLAGCDVGGDGTERDVEVVEMFGGGGLGLQRIHEEFEPLTAEDAGGEVGLESLEVEPGLDQDRSIVLFAAERKIAARHVVGEDRVPVHRGHELLDLLR